MLVKKSFVYLNNTVVRVGDETFPARVDLVPVDFTPINAADTCSECGSSIAAAAYNGLNSSGDTPKYDVCDDCVRNAMWEECGGQWWI